MVLLLAILDGWGIRQEKKGNAIAQAATPNMDSYLKTYPWTLLKASGPDVGLPEGQMGNSEVGHLNIGAGRIVRQASYKIDHAIENQTFFQNPVLISAAKYVKTSRLHLLGLLGPGGVHAYSHHLYALMDFAKKNGIPKNQVKIHGILDGRDTLPTSALGFIQELEKKIDEIDIGSISTLVGRYYAMDRDNRWDRIERAYKLFTSGEGYIAVTAELGITDAYIRGETDEFIQPILVDPTGLIKDGDVVIFYNFRADRARQLTRVFIDKEFNEFQRPMLDVHYVSMIPYQKDFQNPACFQNDVPSNTFGEIISKAGLRQLRVAETEKYAHVTYFFNGGRETSFPGEKHLLIPSPKVDTYDKKPEMSAQEIVEKVVPLLEKYDVIILNFANADMVGHTGVLEAGIKAAEMVDMCVGDIVTEMKLIGGITLITSDHGDLEEMWDRDEKPHTTHTTNPVPFILIGTEHQSVDGDRLADIAPTMLQLLGIKKPSDMTGKSMIS